LYYIDFLILLACPADPEWIGDGLCDDDANSENCQFDGGDCCLDDVVIDFCEECMCYETGITGTKLPPGGTKN
jgi:hypothetical protein